MSPKDEQPLVIKIAPRANRHLIRLAVLNIKHRLQQQGCENIHAALLRACPYNRQNYLTREYVHEWDKAIDYVLDLTRENVDKLKLADWNDGVPICTEDNQAPLWDGTPITPEHIAARKRKG